jgi:hypothetical protein
MLTNISDVYDEIRTILGIGVSEVEIEAIADRTYAYNPVTQAFDPTADGDDFWNVVADILGDN